MIEIAVDDKYDTKTHYINLHIMHNINMNGSGQCIGSSHPDLKSFSPLEHSKQCRDAICRFGQIGK